MSIELSKQVRDEAIASIQQYFERNLPEPIGELGATLLLNYFVEEIGPAIYNIQPGDCGCPGRMQQRIMDLEGELYEDPFRYWRKDKAKRSK
jgi:uncharacterized protein (DUF2164 family)